MSTKNALDLTATLAADAPAAPQGATTAKKAPKKKGRTPKPETLGKTTPLSVSVVMKESLLEAARAAYVADQKNLGDSAPRSMNAWYADAIVHHIKLSPEMRRHHVAVAELGDAKEAAKKAKKAKEAAKKGEAAAVEVDADKQTTAKIRLTVGLDKELTTALMQQAGEGATYLGRSPFVLDAVRCAVQVARRRNGGDLTGVEVPERLTGWRRITTTTE